MSAWKSDSRNFVLTAFSEVGLRVTLTVSASVTLREPLRPYVRREPTLTPPSGIPKNMIERHRSIVAVRLAPTSLASAPFIGHIRDHDLGALLGEPAHGRGTEAASAAGDDR